MTVTVTPAVDVLVASVRLLSEDEQDAVAEVLVRLRAERLLAADSRAASLLGPVQRIADSLGRAPTVTEWRELHAEAAAAGEAFPAVHQLIGFFGSWRRVKEAVALGELSTARQIEERFRKRRLGKIWCYTEQSLRDALLRCAAELGRAPMVAEYTWWRRRELELARARGEDWLHLPSARPYRDRFGSWEGALTHFGFSDRDRGLRHDPTDPGREQSGVTRDPGGDVVASPPPCAAHPAGGLWHQVESL